MLLWAWPLHSADWQVKRQVTGKVPLPAANGGSEVFRQDLQVLPRQPPLNECVRGMRPDSSYITLLRRGRGSSIEAARRKAFSSGLNLFISLCFNCQLEFYLTLRVPPKHLMYMEIKSKIRILRIMSVSNLFVTHCSPTPMLSDSCDWLDVSTL